MQINIPEEELRDIINSLACEHTLVKRMDLAEEYKKKWLNETD